MMNIKLIFPFVIFCTTLAVGVSGHPCHNCDFVGEEGEPCGCSSSQSRVLSSSYSDPDLFESRSEQPGNPFKATLFSGIPIRAANTKPQQISRSKYVEQFVPVGDVCSCKHIKIQPAPIPRQKYSLEPRVKVQPCDRRPLIPAPSHMHDFSQDEEDYVDPHFHGSCDKRSLFPVDAVSLDLVNRMQKNAAISIPEEKLQYGFWSLPREIPIHKVNTNVPEEKLFTVDRQIVELRDPRQVIRCGNGDDEEIVLETDDPTPPINLSYSDLGFVPESDTNTKFIQACHEARPSVKRRIVRPDFEDNDYVYKVRKGDGVLIKKPSAPCNCK